MGDGGGKSAAKMSLLNCWLAELGLKAATGRGALSFLRGCVGETHCLQFSAFSTEPLNLVNLG